MELVRDSTVVRGVDAAKEPVLSESGDHIDVGRVLCGIRSLEEPLYPLLELLIGNHVEVVGRIAIFLLAPSSFFTSTLSYPLRPVLFGPPKKSL